MLVVRAAYLAQSVLRGRGPRQRGGFDRKRIVGAAGIVEFYTGVFEHIAEELEVLDLIVAPDGAALHSRTKFTTIEDWPDFELWPTMKGDVRIVESINMYRTANGKIVKILSGRYSSK